MGMMQYNYIAKFFFVTDQKKNYNWCNVIQQIKGLALPIPPNGCAAGAITVVLLYFRVFISLCYILY